MLFMISGQVRIEGRGVPGLVIKARDRDGAHTDLLGSAVSGEGGLFRFVYEGDEFDKLFAEQAKVCFDVMTPDHKKKLTAIHSEVRFAANGWEEVAIDIPPDTMGRNLAGYA